MIPTNKGPMEPEQILSELIYISYATNRDATPHITPEEWTTIFPNAAVMEVRYQRERACAV